MTNKRLPLASWGLAVLFAAGAAGALSNSSLAETLSRYAPFLLIFAALCFAWFGFRTLRGGELSPRIAAISHQIRQLNAVEGASFTQLPSEPGLEVLVEVLNQLIDQMRERERSSFDILASNRVLARELERTFELLDAIDDGLLMADAFGKIAFSNHAMEFLLSGSPAECKGKPASECINLPNVARLFDQQAEGSMIESVRTIELPPDPAKGRGPVAVVYSPVVDSEGTRTGELLVAHDVTDLKKAERDQSEFVTSVARRLRTPLEEILDAAYKIELRETPENTDAIKLRTTVCVQTERLIQSIDRLHEIAYLEQGAMTLEKTPADLGEILRECADFILPYCEKKGISLVPVFPDRLPAVNVDRSLLSAAIHHLLRNAVTYTDREGSIFMSSTSSEDELTVDIRDTGVGISPEDLPRIFEKLFRLPAPGEDAASGDGIGLAAALQIMRLHDGDIRASSVLGEGSQFSIVLPRSATISSSRS